MRLINHELLKKRPLTFSVRDSAFGQIIGRQFHADFVSRNDTNEVFAHPPCDMRHHLVSGFQLNTESGIGEGLGDRTFDFERFFFFSQLIS